MPREIAVIGAGPAGLSAAWRLADAGEHVRLYERRAAPGGRMRTDRLEGARVDPAVQLLGSYYTETFRLAERAGAADLITRSPGRDALWRGGRARPITYGSVASMTVSSALPASLKLRLATRYLPFLKRHADALDAAEPARAAPAGLDDESIAEWGRREMGADFVELLAYPMLAAYYGATPERTSAGFYHALARAGTDVAVYAVRGGMGALAGAVLNALEARGVEFRGGTEVQAIEPGEHGVTIAREGRRAEHDAAVIALPPRAIEEVGVLDGPAAEWLEEIQTAPAASLALVLDRPLEADYFGLSFPRTSRPGEHVAAVCVERRKGTGLVAEGRGLLVVYPVPELSRRLVDRTPREALDLLLPALEHAFSRIRRRVIRAKLYRFAAGAVQIAPGALEHLRRFQPEWLPPRIALAGGYRIAPTVEGAVRSGRRAAERLLERGRA